MKAEDKGETICVKAAGELEVGIFSRIILSQHTDIFQLENLWKKSGCQNIQKRLLNTNPLDKQMYLILRREKANPSIDTFVQ